MREYEIRVLSAGQIILITSQLQVNDHAAIRSAQTIAADRPFEVWRGMDCVYAGSGNLRTSTAH
jgi:hypothetical protein